MNNDVKEQEILKDNLFYHGFIEWKYYFKRKAITRNYRIRISKIIL